MTTTDGTVLVRHRSWTIALGCALAGAALVACSDEEPDPAEPSGSATVEQEPTPSQDVTTDPPPDEPDCGLPGVDDAVADLVASGGDVDVEFVDDDELASTPFYSGYVDAQAEARAMGGDFCMWTGEDGMVTVHAEILDQAASQQRTTELVDSIEYEETQRVDGLLDLGVWWTEEANEYTGEPFKQIQAARGLGYVTVGVGWDPDDGADPFPLDALVVVTEQAFTSVR